MPVYSEEAHQDIINSIDGIGGTTVNCGAPELVTGSRDGKTYYCDCYNPKFYINIIIKEL